MLDSRAVEQFFSVAAAPNNVIKTVFALIDRGMGNDAWQSFMTRCNEKGISVEALMGDPQWIINKSTDNGPTLQRQLDWIKQYHNNVPKNARFTGIHMDVEPWVVKGWDTNQEAYVNSLVSIADRVTSFAKTANLSVTADLPFWAHSIPCKGSTLGTCMLARLDAATFMTYRNTAQNLIDLATPLLKTAETATPNKRVWLSVETKADVEEAELISYAGKSVGTLLDDMATAEKFAAQYKNFAGIAIHHYKDFIALRS